MNLPDHEPTRDYNTASYIKKIYEKSILQGITYLHETSPDTLRGWFLNSFTTGNFEPIYVAPILSISLQINTLYQLLPEEDQTKIRTALAFSIEDWKPQEHGNQSLTDLTHTVAVINAREAIPTLVRIIDQRHIDDSESTGRQALSSVISVLARFAPDEYIEAAMRRWIMDPSFPPRPIAIVLNGLVRCVPDEYPGFIPRFFEVAGQHPDYFHIGAVLAETTRLATLPRIAEHFHELSLPNRQQFISAWESAINQRVEVSENPPGLSDPKSREFFPVQV